MRRRLLRCRRLLRHAIDPPIPDRGQLSAGTLDSVACAGSTCLAAGDVEYANGSQEGLLEIRS